MGRDRIGNTARASGIGDTPGASLSLRERALAVMPPKASGIPHQTPGPVSGSGLGASATLAPTHIPSEDIRDLVSEDIALMDELSGQFRRGDGVWRMKIRHHEVARRLAIGERQVDIARDMGMTQSHLSILINTSGMFQELVRQYQEVRTDEVLNFETKIKVAAILTIS